MALIKLVKLVKKTHSFFMCDDLGESERPILSVLIGIVLVENKCLVVYFCLYRKAVLYLGMWVISYMEISFSLTNEILSLGSIIMKRIRPGRELRDRIEREYMCFLKRSIKSLDSFDMPKYLYKVKGFDWVSFLSVLVIKKLRHPCYYPKYLLYHMFLVQRVILLY